MVKHTYQRTISDQMRIGTAEQKAALLVWMNRPEFDDRKPTPDELVKECMRKKSPLYGLMKTDESAAAQAYWRTTAQYIIRHVEVVRVSIRTGKAISKPVRAWVPISIKAGGRRPEDSYVPTQRAMKSKATRMTILEQAHRDFEALIERYERYADFLQEFSPVLDAYKSIRQTQEV